MQGSNLSDKIHRYFPVLLIFVLALSILSVETINAKDNQIRFFGENKTTIQFKRARDFDKQIDLTDYGLAEYDESEFNWGLNNLTNLRIKADIGEYLKFYTSINLSVFAGTFTDSYRLGYMQAAFDQGKMLSGIDWDSPVGYFSIPFYYKSTYIGSFDIERLYFEVSTFYITFQTGIIRLARGFGYAFSPIDQFNEKNPINPTALPDGKLAMLFQVYPLGDWRIDLFAIAPENPLEKKGWGSKFGLASNLYIGKVNLEFLYALFMPEMEYDKNPVDNGYPEWTNNDFTQIAGFSLKADIEIGLFLDIVYRFEHRWFKTGKFYDKTFYGYEGLEFAVGIDYTILGKLYILTEYLFNGGGYLDMGSAKLDDAYANDTWYEKGIYERQSNQSFRMSNYLRHHYLFNRMSLKVNDYLNIHMNHLLSIEDQSQLLTIGASVEPFQAMTIEVNMYYPFDYRMFSNDWDAGEFGSTQLGFYQNYEITTTFKF